MEANEITETIAVGKKNSPLEVSSRIISGIFTPFMIPFVAFFLLFFFTYLRIMPIQYKLIVLGIVYCFTILMPMLAIYLFQKINGWGIHELGHREKRFVPYALTIISYVTCLITMYKIHLPRYMSGIIVAALICMILCTLINFKWKISTHVASSGMMVGGLLSYSFIFNFNPVWWLLFFHFAIRDAWHSPYHCKTAYLIRSFSRIYCRIVLWCHWNFVYLKKLVLTL